MGMPPSPEEIGQKIHVTAIHQGWSRLSLYPPPPKNRNLDTVIHHLPFTKPPTSISAQINAPQPTSEYLLKALHEARRNKTPQEIEKMKKANEITAGAHKHLMELVGKGELTDENAAEAAFVAYCRKRGYVAFLSIRKSGLTDLSSPAAQNTKPTPQSLQPESRQVPFTTSQTIKISLRNQRFSSSMLDVNGKITLQMLHVSFL